MKHKAITQQRLLFSDWPAWQQLPKAVSQQVSHQLANMCLDIVDPYHDTRTALNAQEQRDEPRTD
jgi:hypothetical protein